MSDTFAGLDEPTPHSPMKVLKPEPGAPAKLKTSEFWITAILTISALLLMSGVVPVGSGFEKMIGIILLSGASLGYTVNRSLLKKGTAGANKSGFKTTEFWLTSLSAISGLVIASDAANGTAVELAGVISAVAASMGYKGFRAVVKKSGTVIILAMLMFGCTPTVMTKGSYEAFSVILPEYRQYIEADDTLDDKQVDRRKLLLKAISQRAEATGYGPIPSTPEKESK